MYNISACFAFWYKVETATGLRPWPDRLLEQPMGQST